LQSVDKLLFAAFLGLVVLGVWDHRIWLSDHIPFLSHYMLDGVPPPVVGALNAPGKSASTQVKPATPSRTKEGEVALGGVTVVDVPYQGQPFPEPKDLPTGLSAAEIRAGFGDPSAHVTLSSNGQLVERYYYLNKEHTRYTILDLQDGRLIAASSKPL
jgi:hypothetical protein